MEPMVRGLAVYLFLLAVFRLSGKRTFSKATAFDFALLLIIAETTQQALVGQDYSVTGALILILTLVGLDVLFSVLKQRSRRLEWLMDGVPLLILADGRPLDDRMRRERIDVEDVLTQARQRHGLSRLDQIRYAVLERDGSISIVPRGANPARGSTKEPTN